MPNDKNEFLTLPMGFNKGSLCVIGQYGGQRGYVLPTSFIKSSVLNKLLFS